MRSSKWHEGLSVKIDTFDKQHKEMFEAITTLAIAIECDEPKKVINKAIDHLRRLTISHFKEEEDTFTIYEYPDSNVHTKEHQDFINKMNAILAIYENGRYALSIDTVHYIQDWLTSHIRTSDMAYSAFIMPIIHHTA